ncbi:MAG: isoamylase early set domain-containing protein [Syntrophales bacterium]|jgi:1,4-alpha-glucan branching enzyme|nr:isoamylase early set domain-containing protein [Syntrophales bacterium]MDY0043554.1 isoamylase early set domain-containing protein [Syntrophales bacterium]
MSLKKKYLTSKNICKVTFHLSGKAVANGELVNLVGDFNGWNQEAFPMKKLKNGDFSITVDLVPGHAYEFRYLIDKTRWENDWCADRYSPSQFPYCDNSVVEI